MANKLYEIEIQRTNISPRQFFTYCKKQVEKRGSDLELFIDNFKEWSNPSQPYGDGQIVSHDDWEVPQKEICKTKPYDFQLYLQNSYNFIIEFEFDTETKGHGYMYMVEYER